MDLSDLVHAPLPALAAPEAGLRQKASMARYDDWQIELIKALKVEDSCLEVVKGKKVIYIIDFGEIVSTICFVNSAPNSSVPHIQSTAESLLVPHNWQILTVVKDYVIIATAVLDPNRGRMCYHVLKVEENGHRTQSQSRSSPGDAFNDVGLEFLNAKMLFGCFHEGPQNILRNHFRKKLDDGLFDSDQEFKTCIHQWLEGKVVGGVTSKAPRKSRQQTELSVEDRTEETIDEPLQDATAAAVPGSNNDPRNLPWLDSLLEDKELGEYGFLTLPDSLDDL